MPKRYRLLLALVSVLSTFVLLEVSLRAYDQAQGRGFFGETGNLLRAPKRPIVPFRTFGFDPYVSTDGETRISDRWQRTYPMEKPPGTIRIVAFGGSTTENHAGQHYPLYLEQELRRRLGHDRVEVLNVANAAYSTPHSISLMALDVASWNPDLVILSHNVNDLTTLYWPGFRPDYWNKYAHEFYAYPDYEGIYSWSNVLFQNSRLYWFLNEHLRRWTDESEIQSVELRRRPYPDDELARGTEIFRRNLETFIGVARTHGATVALGTQPLEPSLEAFLRGMAHKTYNDVVVYPPHEEFVAHHELYNETIRRVAAETDATLVDNAPLFRERPELFVDFVHYREDGLRLLAQNYADVIVPELQSGTSRPRTE